MTKLGKLNSRMKDYFEIWSLFRPFDFEGALLSQAIAATFRHRGTEILALPTALTEQFAKDPVKQTQWLAFVRKTHLPSTVEELPLVVEALGIFLLPLPDALSRGKNFEDRWTAPGPRS